MTTENGNLSTASLELVKRELGGIREFYEQRMNAEIPPLREEVERIGSQLTKLQDARRQGEKQSLLSQFVGDRSQVMFGKYAGMEVVSQFDRCSISAPILEQQCLSYANGPIRYSAQSSPACSSVKGAASASMTTYTDSPS